jgi:hypothetical protein
MHSLILVKNEPFDLRHQKQRDEPTRLRYAFNHQIVKFSTAAKLTQARYGNIIQPATGDDRKNAAAVAAIVSHRTKISAKAQPG